jgi:hypothetical protein
MKIAHRLKCWAIFDRPLRGLRFKPDDSAWLMSEANRLEHSGKLSKRK